MSPWIVAAIVVSSNLFYFTVAAHRYRSTYVAMRTRYLRWQNEAPDEMAQIVSDYYQSDRPRKQVNFYNYRTGVDRELSPLCEATAWPLLIWGKPLASWLHPEVKVPSVVAIDMLEDLIPEVDHGLCSPGCPEKKQKHECGPHCV